MHNIQLLATQALGQVLGGRNLNHALDELRRAHPELNPQQRAALQDMSFTALRWLGRLQALLTMLLQRPLSDARVHNLLIIALGQLEYGKSPSHAVVDNAVRAAGMLRRPWAKSLVNAVLRNFLRERERWLAALKHNESAQLSYPDWWIAKLREQYPAESTAVLAAGNTHPPMTLRVNRRKVSRDDYLQMLVDADIAARAAGAWGIVLGRPLSVEKLPGFAEGLVSVQDLGAQQAAPLLEVETGMHVLDACSAPGGKAAHVLELADVELFALDNDAARLSKVTDNLRRLELAGVVKQGNAAQPETWWDGRPFDRILADVPCSASGIVRRHPDIKWLRRETDIASFAAQQADILRGLWSTLAKGGKLLYATCSVFHEENEWQVEAFLAERSDARRLPLGTLALSSPAASDLQEESQLLPCDAHDGFYYALLQKT